MNRNAKFANDFRAGSQPVQYGKVSLAGVSDAEADHLTELFKAFVKSLRGGSADPSQLRHLDAASGANVINVAVSPTGIRAGSDRMLTPQRNRNTQTASETALKADGQKNPDAVLKGTLGMHSRHHLAKGVSHPTCIHCQLARAGQVNNQARHLQAGEE